MYIIPAVAPNRKDKIEFCAAGIKKMEDARPLATLSTALYALPTHCAQITLIEALKHAPEEETKLEVLERLEVKVSSCSEVCSRVFNDSQSLQ